MAIPIWSGDTSLSWGAQGSPWGSYTATGTVTGATVTLGTGWWFVFTGAHNTCQGVVSSGTTSVTFVPASSQGLVFSDGASTVIINDSTGGSAAHYAQILGGGP